MKPFHQDKQTRLFKGDCREVLAMHYGRDSMDAIITDPPYGLNFMNNAWDRAVPGVEYWKEFIRVAKPGAHMLVFGGTRTFHRLAVAIEDAGWEIRDTIMWVYSSGFPKSHNLKGSRAGWGTTLKPAWDPILLCRKPLDGTVAANVQRWGTGAINVDASRIPAEPWQRIRMRNDMRGGNYASGNGKKILVGDGVANSHPAGRWPANLIHDGSDEVLAVFPEAKGAAGDVKGTEASQSTNYCYGIYQRKPQPKRGDSGSAARIFYCAKASKADREEGLTKMALRPRPKMLYGIGNQPNRDAACNRNHHPTVKPTSLMRYLCRLITPPGGVIFDGFMGSGTTGKAAVLEGFLFVGAEINRDYATIARARVKHAQVPA